MSEELVLVLSIIFATGIVGYFFLGGEVSLGKLAASQVARYASNAGFAGDDLVTAVAIALAESGGDPSIEGDSGTSYGLWQIHWTVHPEFYRSKLKDPQYNANAAYALYFRRGNFKDWTTYNEDTYASFLNTAQAGVNA